MTQESMTIDIDGGRRAFSPGEAIAGRVTWSGELAPRSAELRLFWYTAGKGTQNMSVAAAVPFENPGQSDRREFRLSLPNEPFSCSGTLVSIVWALELILEPKGLTERVELTIGPNGQEVVLGNTRP